MNKEHQKNLIVEIMNEDQKDGLYKSINQGLYHTTTVGAQKEKIEKLMNELVRFMDKLGYDVDIKFNKRNNE